MRPRRGQRGRGKKKLTASPDLLFQYRLALALGRTHAELIREMGSGEMATWRALTLIDGPLTNERSDIHTAMLCCVMANSQGSKTKPKDYMPKWGGAVEVVSGKQGMEMLESWAIGHNARLVRDKT